ncbi:hypothetical protein KSS87_016052 [Heliosperma pusillum]|nr:hypothetical protein KSS87_016052 [Heliosperma pusillum]
MALLELFVASSMPVLKVLLITTLGSFLALERVGVLGEDARKHLNKIVFFVFNPALVSSNLAKALTHERKTSQSSYGGSNKEAEVLKFIGEVLLKDGGRRQRPPGHCLRQKRMGEYGNGARCLRAVTDESLTSRLVVGANVKFLAIKSFKEGFEAIKAF